MSIIEQSNSQGKVRSRRLGLHALYALLFGLPLLGATIVVTHNVPVSMTDDDLKYIPQLFGNAGKSHLTRDSAIGKSLVEQASIVSDVQAAVLSTAQKTDPIDFDREREPKDLLELRHGLCFDRSRVIEKALSYVGLRARHVAIYSLVKTKTAFQALLKPGNSSHAVTEVLTEKGWMVVDPDLPWIGLTADLEAISIQTLHRKAFENKKPCHPLARSDLNSIFSSDFTYVNGLYSRHGRFYPPYNVIPDVNWMELMSNFYD